MRPRVEMVPRACALFMLALMTECGSEVFQETSSPSSPSTLPTVPLERRLQYQQQGYGNTGYNGGGYSNGGNGNSAYYNGNGGYSNSGYNNGGSYSGMAHADDSRHYMYPGQGSARSNQASSNAQGSVNATYQSLSGAAPPVGSTLSPEMVADEENPFMSTTMRWEGSSVASSGSTPSNSLDSFSGSSTNSFQSSSGSGKSRASQWSSSGSGSGSGWLWPWDYRNYPWVLPYWRWWQYAMALICLSAACCLCVCCATYVTHHCSIEEVICHCCGLIFGQSKKKSKKPARHKTRAYRDEDEDSEDSEEDLEDDPLRSYRQGSVQSQGRGPRGFAPSFHGPGYPPPMGAYHPQHRY